MFTDEIWKDISGFEGYYKASNLGRIISLRSGKIMSTKKHLRGYPQINFSVNGKRSVIYIHRIIAETFLIKSNDKNTVDHKDENKKNNSVNNLSWCSQNDNIKMFHERRLSKNRIEKHMKLTKADVNHIRDEANKRNSSIKKISKGYGVKLNTVYKIVSRDIWKAI